MNTKIRIIKLKYLHPYNESIKDYLKPKSVDDIRKSLEKLTPDQRFLKGCEHGVLSWVKDAIKDGADPICMKNLGIVMASEEGHIDIVKYLLENEKVDPSDQNNNAIFFAIDYGHYDVTVLLFNDERVKKGLIKTNELKYVEDYFEKMDKSKQDINEGIKDFLKPKSDDDIRNSINNLSDRQKFDKALTFGIVWLLEELLDNGFNSPTNIQRLMNKACVKGYIDVVKMVLSRNDIGAYINNHGSNDLATAAAHNHKDIVEFILNDGRVDPTQFNNYAIQCALEEHNKDIIKLLLNDKRVKNRITRTLYSKCVDFIESVNESVKDYLKPKSKEEIGKLTTNLSPDKKLLMGSEFGILELVKQGLEEGANPKINGNSPIRLASSHGHVDIVDLLLKTPEVNPAIFSNTPISLASHYGYLDVVKSLINDKRVDPSDIDNSAIKSAAANNHTDIVKLLLQDERVINSLTETEIKYFTKKSLNESVKDYLKPKSEDDIINNTKDLIPQEKFEKGCLNDILWLVKQSIDEGADPKKPIHWQYGVLYYCFEIAYLKNYTDILDYLVELPELEELINYNKMPGYNKKQNESVKDYLKPKSMDQMKKSLETMSKEDKNKIMYELIRNEDLKMMLFMLNSGLEINNHMMNIATTCSNLSAHSLLKYTREKRNKKK